MSEERTELPHPLAPGVEDTAEWPLRLDVLVLGRDPAALDRLLDVLSSDGMRVRGVRRLCDALDALAERTPDVVVTDLQLGDERGDDLARALYRDPRRAAMRLVALTDAAETDWERFAWFDSYLRTPVDAALVPALLHHLVSQPSDRVGALGALSARLHSERRAP